MPTHDKATSGAVSRWVCRRCLLWFFQRPADDGGVTCPDCHRPDRVEAAAS
jgi:hypothetical protein